MSSFAHSSLLVANCPQQALDKVTEPVEVPNFCLRQAQAPYTQSLKSPIPKIPKSQNPQLPNPSASKKKRTKSVDCCPLYVDHFYMLLLR